MKNKTHITIILLFVLTGVSSYAQLQAPKQTDTLFIQSMTYHYDNIRPENWPFKYVIRKADAFVFGSQEFKILDSNNYLGQQKIFTLSDGKEEASLIVVPQNNACVFKFSGYELVCNSGKAIDNTPKNKLNPRECFPGIAKDQTEGKPNAHLKGRSVDGALPRPTYNVQESGIVVVTILVDNYGKVQKAVAGVDGTTTTDKKLWAAARKAAMETRFTMDSNAPALQQGSITYVFNLK